MIVEQFLLAGFTLAADRVSKAWAGRLRAGEVVAMGSWLRIRLVMTRFPHRGLTGSRLLLVLLWLVALGGFVLAVRTGHFFQTPTAQMGLGAALAGSASNLYDRLERGAIVDFLDVGWWPVFNIADVAITLGIAVGLWFL